VRSRQGVWHDADVSTESNPVEGFREAVGELAAELGSLVPRLFERSRDQIAVVAKLIEQLPCLGVFGGSASAPGNTTAPTPTPAPDLRLVPSGADDEPIEAVIVDTPAPAKEARAAKKAPAGKKAPAAKKVPAGAKKASPVKKATAKNAPARKAAASNAPAKRTAAAARPASAPVATGPSALAIPDYDQLAASQVIPRLDSMSADELEAIRLHETSHRQRRTILSRVAQLQAS
jgi:hypothetical protein